MTKDELSSLLYALHIASQEHGVRIGQGNSDTHATFVRVHKAMTAVEDAVDVLVEERQHAPDPGADPFRAIVSVITRVDEIERQLRARAFT